MASQTKTPPSQGAARQHSELSLNPRKVTMPKQHSEKRRARRPRQRQETQLTQLTFDQQFTPDPNLTRPRHPLRATQTIESPFTPDQARKEE